MIINLIIIQIYFKIYHYGRKQVHVELNDYLMIRII